MALLLVHQSSFPNSLSKLSISRIDSSRKDFSLSAVSA
jgi:hypothetical protein